MEDILLDKRIVSIVGAGGLGRELASWINLEGNQDYVLRGFWDDNLKAFDNIHCNYDLLGETAKIKGNVLLGIMDSEIKKKLVNAFDKKHNINLLSYSHKSTIVGERTVVDKGSVFFPNVLISCDVTLGKGCFLNLGVQVGHDVSIGDYTSIMPSVNIGGGSIIGDSVFIGTGVVILPGVKIPSNCRIGAGSVVVKSIKEVGTYFGNPAKKIF